MWGSSPQVLRLQAQAQKRARLLQQHHLPSSVSPLSPSKSPQVQSTLDINSDISGPLLLSPTSTSAAAPVYVMQQESSPTGDTESVKEELPDMNLKLVLNSYDSELPSALLSNSMESVDSVSSTPTFALNSVECHKFSAENNSSASDVDNKGCVNNEKWSSQSSDEFPLSKCERICGKQLTKMPHFGKCMQESQSRFFGSEEKREEFQSSFECDNVSWNKKSLQLPSSLIQDSSESNAQPVLSSVCSDCENANMGTSSRDMHPPGSSLASRRMDQNLNLKVCFVL